MNEHTPGPWFVEGDARPGMEWNRHIMSGPNTAVCFMAHSDGADPQRDRANAHLIAGAPELLEACRAMVAWDHAEKNAKPFDEDGGNGFYERIALCAAAFDKARAAIAKATGAA